MTNQTNDNAAGAQQRPFGPGDTIKFTSWVNVPDTDLAFAPNAEALIYSTSESPFGSLFAMRGSTIKPDGTACPGDYALPEELVYKHAEFVRQMELEFEAGWVLRMPNKHPVFGNSLVVVTHTDRSDVDAPYSVMKLGKTGDKEQKITTVGIDLQDFAIATHVRVGNLVAFTKELDHVPAGMVAKVVSIEGNKILMRNNAQSGFVDTAHDPYDLFECTETFCSDPTKVLTDIRKLTKVLELLHDSIPTPPPPPLASA